MNRYAWFVAFITCAILFFGLLAMFLALGTHPAWGNGPDTGEAERLSSFAPGAPTAGIDGDRWVWHNPIPQGISLASVDFVDAQTGWAVGDAGAIVKTTDGGTTWTRQTSGTTNRLNAVTFQDTQTGWAVGDHGAVIKTSDGGGTWIHQSSGVSNTLLSVAFIDARTGWAVGGEQSFNPFIPSVSAIIKTTDGGATWNRQTAGAANLLNSVTFVDARTGWAVGYNGTVLSTLDGGATWTAQSSGTTDNLSSVSFVNTQTGWAVGFGGSIIKTTDGGTTWSRQDFGFGWHLQSVTFVSDQQGWAVGYASNKFVPPYSFIQHTADGGTTWQLQASSEASRQTSVLYGIAAVNARTAWAVGSLGNILKTNDAGTTWIVQSSLASDYLQSVSFADARTGWAAGSNYGGIIKTSDGGVNWVRQTPVFFGYFDAMAAVNAQTAWAVGGNGAIIKTSDGGATWIQQSSGITNSLLRSVDFVDSQTGWAVGGTQSFDPAVPSVSTIIKTTDGGTTWITQTSGITSSLQSVSFINAQTGWAVGGQQSFDPAVPSVSTIIKTTDGGTTWTRQTSGTPNQLNSVTFIDAQTGWAVGFGGAILKTTDGGATWTRQTSGTVYDLKSVAFVDAQTGWAVGMGGIILKTSDGGTTWRFQSSGTNNLNSVAFVDAQTGWAVGDLGTVLRHVAISPTIPNLSVTKLANRDNIQPGEALGYVILLDNTGSVPISVALTDTLPLGTSLITGTVAGGAVYSPTLNSVLWSGAVPVMTSTLPSLVLDFRVTVDNPSPTKTITNTVLVSNGSITTTASARTEVSRRTFLPIIRKGLSAW